MDAETLLFFVLKAFPERDAVARNAIALGRCGPFFYRTASS
jgi:hypothetical protein